MGYDLHRRKTDAGPFEAEAYHINCAGWSWLVRKAVTYGWTHPGMMPPIAEPGEEDRVVPEDEWDGGYMTNDGQYVTPVDAAAWADALERALRVEKESPRWLGMGAEFIAYCREGGFEIF